MSLKNSKNYCRTSFTIQTVVVLTWICNVLQFFKLVEYVFLFKQYIRPLKKHQNYNKTHDQEHCVNYVRCCIPWGTCLHTVKQYVTYLLVIIEDSFNWVRKNVLSNCFDYYLQFYRKSFVFYMKNCKFLTFFLHSTNHSHRLKSGTKNQQLSVKSDDIIICFLTKPETCFSLHSTYSYLLWVSFNSEVTIIFCTVLNTSIEYIMNDVFKGISTIHVPADVLKGDGS